jgi:hypothetical protein
VHELDVILRKAIHTTSDLRYDIGNLLITSHLARLAALKPAPLTVQIVVPFEPGTVSFDASS